MADLVFLHIVRRRVDRKLVWGLPLGNPRTRTMMHTSALFLALCLALFLLIWCIMSGRLILTLAMGVPRWTPLRPALIQGAAQ